MLSQHFSYPSASTSFTSAACTSAFTGMYFFFFLFTHLLPQHPHPIHIRIPSTSASASHPCPHPIRVRIPSACHDRDNSRLAPSENARKANTGRHERTRASTVPPQQSPSERASNASTLTTCLTFVKSTLALYLLYLDSSLSSRLIGIHMYPSALRPSRLTSYD